MINNVKIISLIVCCILCSAILTNAAIVSSDDGAAFVTKKELMDLQAELSMIIDTYNESLNNKIDGVISSYLDGLRVTLKSTRRKMLNDADHWLMYNKNDYPTYVEGYPYLSGYTMCGYYNDNYSSGTRRFCSWFGVNFNGRSEYRTNPSFKRHIVGKPSKNAIKNGNENYVAEWKGFYQKEGDFISLGSYDPHIGGGDWVSDNMNYIKLESPQTFANAACPVYMTGICLQNESRAYFISSKLECSAAQRIVGEIVGDTYVSTYQNISDNRFWQDTVANVVGITETTPAIPVSYAGSTMTSWFTTVVPSSNLLVAGSFKSYNATTSPPQYKNIDSSSGGIKYNCSNSYTITSYGVNGTDAFGLMKLANDPNNLQFVRLWSAKTDNIAQRLNARYENSQTSTVEKNQIKAALIWDEDSLPHLSMGAGYPFLEVSYDEKVEFDFKINESGNYRVYAKYGPFSPTGDPATEADVRFEITSSGTTTTSTTLPVTGGTNAKMKFDVTKDGTNYIFLKWCDTTGNNGGTMDLSKDPVVIPAL